METISTIALYRRIKMYREEKRREEEEKDSPSDGWGIIEDVEGIEKMHYNI